MKIWQTIETILNECAKYKYVEVVIEKSDILVAGIDGARAFGYAELIFSITKFPASRIGKKAEGIAFFATVSKVILGLVVN